jgi:hypothetical protein
MEAESLNREALRLRPLGNPELQNLAEELLN